MALTLLLDKIFFTPQIPQLAEMEPVTWWKGLIAGVLYGGIIEEIGVRLFIMTLIIWVHVLLYVILYNIFNLIN